VGAARLWSGAHAGAQRGAWRVTARVTAHGDRAGRLARGRRLGDRSPHPADRRATIISLTPASEATLTRLTDSYRALAHDLLGDVHAEDLSRCRAVTGQLKDRLDTSVSKRVAALDAHQAEPHRHRAG
jgi:hypothetical protein